MHQLPVHHQLVNIAQGHLEFSQHCNRDLATAW